MHARHRSPGNGYKSSSMGTGLGASRISPDTSARGHGFYSSEYRSFNNRGFGRGQGPPKSFQQQQQPPPPPHPPPPRKGDILMEAGRLAAEYLVAKGLLPQSALSAKWQNGSFKKQVGDYQDFRQQEDHTPEGRTSAHARLGIAPSDAVAGGRRYSDDFNSRNHVKGRRRGEYYRSYSSEWGREYGRSGSLLDRNTVSPDMEGEDDTASGHFEELQVGNDDDDGMQKPGLSGLAPESEEAGDIELGQEKYNYQDELGSEPSSSNAGKDDKKDDTNGEPSKESDDLTKLNLGNGEMKDSNNGDENEKQIIPEDLSIQDFAVEGDLPSKNGSDLLTLCKFVKVPTKTRSALTCRTSKYDQVSNNEEENALDIVPAERSEVVVQDAIHDASSADAPENTTSDSNCPNSYIPKLLPVQSAEDAGEMGPVYGAGEVKCLRPQSYPDRDFVHHDEQESSPGLRGFGRSTSVEEQGEKRAIEESDMNEANKKPREWLPSSVPKADKHLHLSNLSKNIVGSQAERLSSDQQLVAGVTHESFTDTCQFPKTGGEPGVKYAQEKQLFPSSFKICDLNLMEASDMNDNHRSDPVLMYPAIMTTEKETSQVDVDLSINNSSGEYARRISNSKEIEVIDLEHESTPEDEAFDNSQTKTDTAFTGTEGFPSHVQNTGDITDVQDNYDGLMMSEFLTTFSNSVPEDINPLQNEMGLHNGEGNLGDDDSIYMSLGEIPLSFIPAWGQPTPQEYDKPF